MIDWFFYLFSVLTLGLLGLAYFRKSLAFGILGVVLMILVGVALNAEGIERQEGTNIICNTDCTDCNTSLLYTTYTQYNNTWIWTLGFILQWGGFAGLMALGGLILIPGRRR